MQYEDQIEEGLIFGVPTLLDVRTATQKLGILVSKIHHRIGVYEMLDLAHQSAPHEGGQLQFDGYDCADCFTNSLQFAPGVFCG